MDPINLAKQFFVSSFSLAQAINNGALGDAYDLSLHSWRSSKTEVRGEFLTSQSQKFEAPGYSIVSASRGSFLDVKEHGIVEPDGTVEIVWTESSSEPFSITQASRENWSCEVPGMNGPLARITRIADFKLLLVATIPKPSRLVRVLGGGARVHIEFPGSCPALSPCTSMEDFSGQNLLGAYPGGVARSDSVFLTPASLKGTTVIPPGARALIHPQRVNWVYWDAPLGFGPRIVFDGYGPGNDNRF